jgi:fucose permease
MAESSQRASFQTLAVLHPVFALTGVLHVVGGAILPSLARRFELSDAAAGSLFLAYFAGTSVGALLCRGRYARLITIGFAGMVCTCLAVAWSPPQLLVPVFFFLGVSVGIPMSAVTLFTGRTFPERCAAQLTFLNFSWSIGALAAPLIAARVLMFHSYRAAYIVFAAASTVSAIACAFVLHDGPEPVQTMDVANAGKTGFYLVAIFAVAAFLQVGMENTVSAWLPTYVLRMAGSGIVFAAVSSSFYWAGFLSSRGLSSLLLLRAPPMRVLRISIALGIASALLLELSPSIPGRSAAMFLLGASLAPTYPLVLASFFARARRTSDSRWILFTAGFGGSVVPWMAGFISTQTGSLREGMLVVPAGLMLMVFIIPGLRKAEPADQKVRRD